MRVPILAANWKMNKTVSEALDLDVPAPIITLALQMRFRSRQEQPFAARMLAALRNQFGGHGVKTD